MTKTDRDINPRIEDGVAKCSGEDCPFYNPKLDSQSPGVVWCSIDPDSSHGCMAYHRAKLEILNETKAEAAALTESLRCVWVLAEDAEENRKSNFYTTGEIAQALCECHGKYRDSLRAIVAEEPKCHSEEKLQRESAAKRVVFERLVNEYVAPLHNGDKRAKRWLQRYEEAGK